MKKQVVYVSGHYSDPTVNGVFENIVIARRVARHFWLLGYPVICPHANTFLMDGEGTYGTFLEGDLELLARSDIIVMLPDWENSKGAAIEHRVALSLHKRIWYVDEEEVIHDHPIGDGSGAGIDRDADGAEWDQTGTFVGPS